MSDVSASAWYHAAQVMHTTLLLVRFCCMCQLHVSIVIIIFSPWGPSIITLMPLLMHPVIAVAHNNRICARVNEMTVHPVNVCIGYGSHVEGD